MFDKMNGIGAHEVIIETPDHDSTLATLPEQRDRRRAVGVSRPRDRPEERPAVPLHPDFQESWRSGGRFAGAPAFAADRAADRAQARAGRSGNGEALLREKERCIFCDMIRQETRTGDARGQRERAVHRARALCSAVSRSRCGFCPSSTARHLRIIRARFTRAWRDAEGYADATWIRCSIIPHTIS